MKKGKIHTADIKLLVKSQQDSIRFYWLIIVSLIILTIILFFGIRHYIFKDSDKPEILQYIVPSFTFIFGSVFPFKEIRTKYEKIDAFQIVLLNIQRVEKNIDEIDETEIDKMKELVWKIIEKTVLT